MAETSGPDSVYAPGNMSGTTGNIGAVGDSVAGIAAMGIYAVISYLKVKNQVKVSLHEKENIYYCDTIETPFDFGMFRARIYLPSGLDEATAEYVIRHEQEHLRCRDMWILNPLE